MSHAESTHHFIENQYGAMVLRERPQRLQELFRWRHATHVATNRLQDHRRDPIAVCLKRVGQHLCVIVIQHHRVLAGPRSHARRIRNGQSRCRATSSDQQAINVAMIITSKLDHDVSTGVSSRQSNRTHRRFGSRIDQSHHFNRRHRVNHQFGEFIFRNRWRTKARPTINRCMNRFADPWPLMPKDHRPPRTDVIDVPIPIDIEQVSTFTSFEHQRFTTDGTEGPSGTVHASRHQRFGSCVFSLAILVVEFRLGHGGSLVIKDK